MPRVSTLHYVQTCKQNLGRVCSCFLLSWSDSLPLRYGPREKDNSSSIELCQFNHALLRNSTCAFCKNTNRTMKTRMLQCNTRLSEGADIVLVDVNVLQRIFTSGSDSYFQPPPFNIFGATHQIGLDNDKCQLSNEA